MPLLSLFSNWRNLLITGLGLLVIVSFIGLSWMHSNNERLRDQVTALDIDNKAKDATIDLMTQRMQLLSRLNSQFNQQVNAIRRTSAEEIRKLREMRLQERVIIQPREVEADVNTRVQGIFNDLNGPQNSDPARQEPSR